LYGDPVSVRIPRVSRSLSSVLVLSLAFVPLGCPADDDDPPGMDATTSPPTDTGTNDDSGVADMTDTGVTPPRVDAGAGMMLFRLRIENRSDQTPTPTALSPVVWALHDATDPFFTEGQADRGAGLEGLAEDGEARPFEASLNTTDHGVIDTPAGAAMAGPLTPGEAYEMDILVSTMGAPKLSIATMVVESNDVILAPSGAGIELVDGTGQPLTDSDVTSQLFLWDVGTETNEAPRQGPNQPARQSQPNTGAAEGLVREFDAATHALPLPSSLLTVEVVPLGGGDVEISFTNVSDAGGAMDTSMSSVFWATHNDTWQLFTEGQDAPPPMEALAENNDPDALVTAVSSMLGVGTATATADKPSPGLPIKIELTPSMDHPWLSFAIGLDQTNDVFLALPPGGVRLVGADGQLRSTRVIAAEIATRLALWDAGTEANEVPGAGPNQPRRQTGGSGPSDPNTAVRKYADATNALAMNAGGLVSLTITNGANADEFDVVFENTSGQTGYTTAMSPLVYALHDGNAVLFRTNQPPSAELELLAEDGNPSMLKAMLSNLPNTMSATQEVPTGGPGVAPIFPGERYSWSITGSAATPFFALASMIVGSNDAFVALGGGGIRLYDRNGTRLTDAMIAASVAQGLKAYDAGSEANQVGAAGPDAAANQTMAGSGAAEGDGTVRKLDHPAWKYPPVTDLVRVTVTPR